MLIQVLQKTCRNSLQQRVSAVLDKGENWRLSHQLKNRVSMSLGLLFCPVMVVQSCMPGGAYHSRGHRAHHSTVLEGAMKAQADNELVEMGSQNSHAAENWWLLETQLIQPQMNPEMVSPWEKEWSSGRCTVLSLHYFLLFFFVGPESTFLLLLLLPPSQNVARLIRTESRNCLLKQLVCFSSMYWQTEAEGKEKRL